MKKNIQQGIFNFQLPSPEILEIKNVSSLILNFSLEDEALLLHLKVNSTYTHQFFEL